MKRKFSFMLLICPTVALAACQRSEEQRKSVLESAERTNHAIIGTAALRDLRAPSDTGRLVYDPPVSLNQRTAYGAGARQMWAPFGIATPDTVERAVR